jgi:hypothetical protein
MTDVSGNASKVTLTKSDGSEVEVYRRLVRLDDHVFKHCPLSAIGDPDPAGAGGHECPNRR